ncbi:sigma-70 family RNA polymerase sigma factor [Candidatus Dojkabacteria bacterium]|nr:sigma-70 family RNA polymerase sigma factor [Candidatus Dojkabacteria bacterium]
MVDQIKDENDFTLVYKEFNSPVFNYVYFRTGLQKEKAEDITQDVFLKIWKKRKTIKKNKSLRAWIFTIARNTVIDFYRTNKKTTSLDDLNYYDFLEAENVSKDDPILFDYLTKQMSKLSNKDQELITLKYINQLSIKEISKVIKKSNTATKVAIHRALKRLKKIISEQKQKNKN